MYRYIHMRLRIFTR